MVFALMTKKAKIRESYRLLGIYWSSIYLFSILKESPCFQLSGKFDHNFKERAKFGHFYRNNFFALMTKKAKIRESYCLFGIYWTSIYLFSILKESPCFQLSGYFNHNIKEGAKFGHFYRKKFFALMTKKAKIRES